MLSFQLSVGFYEPCRLKKTNKKNLGRFTYETERTVAAVKQFLFQLMMTLRWLSWYWQFHQKDETFFFQSFFFYSLLQNCSISCHTQDSIITMLVGSIQCMLPITSLDCPFIRAHCFTRWRLKGVKKLIFCRRYKMHCGLIFLLLWVPYFNQLIFVLTFSTE